VPLLTAFLKYFPTQRLVKGKFDRFSDFM